MLETVVANSPLLYFVQSVWRDEAFSILVASKPITFFISKLSFEPPVYYVLLHFWIKLFGTSEIAARSLSFLAFAGAVAIVIEWSDRLFRKTYLAWLVPLLFFTNPMLLYYAFEIRTYGWYVFFATLSMFAYDRKRWRLYAASAILGFYTHSYFLFVIASQVLHYAVINRKKLMKKSWVLTDTGVRAFFISGLAILPWLLKIVAEAAKLKSSWYYPVDFQLVKSVLGNMYTSYEGTPWYGWRFTAYLSLILIAMFAYAYKKSRDRSKITYFLISVFLPLTVVIGISFVKPLFVNRYLIPVTVAIVMLTGYFLAAVKSKVLRAAAAFVILAFNVAVNIWFPHYKAKVPIRNTMRQVNAIAGKDDLIYATSPLVLFETEYYAKDPGRVFLYNPKGGTFPWYVGDAVFSPDRMVSLMPEYPQRAILINPDGTFTVSYRVPEAGTTVPVTAR